MKQLALEHALPNTQDAVEKKGTPHDTYCSPSIEQSFTFNFPFFASRLSTNLHWVLRLAQEKRQLTIWCM